MLFLQPHDLSGISILAKEARAQPLVLPWILRLPSLLRTPVSYRFAWPRAIFFTLGFLDPRAYSRGFFGFSSFIFLRAVRFAFFRSSLLSFFVFAMNASIVLYRKVLIRKSSTQFAMRSLKRPETIH